MRDITSDIDLRERLLNLDARQLHHLAAALTTVEADRATGGLATHAASHMLAGYVVAQADVHLTGSEIRDALREQLPDYMVPATINVLPSMPLTANGKVDRAALPEPEIAAAEPVASDSGGDVRQPANEIEQTLADIWADVLGIEIVDVRDNFFELGGDSLLSIRIVARAGEAGLQISPEEFVENPDIESMAALLAAKQSDPSSGGLRPPWVQHDERPAYVCVRVPPAGALSLAAAHEGLREIAARHDGLRARLDDAGTLNIAPKAELHVCETALDDAAELASPAAAASADLALALARDGSLLLAAPGYKLDTRSWCLLIHELTHRAADHGTAPSLLRCLRTSVDFEASVRITAAMAGSVDPRLHTRVELPQSARDDLDRQLQQPFGLQLDEAILILIVLALHRIGSLPLEIAFDAGCRGYPQPQEAAAVLGRLSITSVLRPLLDNADIAMQIRQIKELMRAAAVKSLQPAGQGVAEVSPDVSLLCAPQMAFAAAWPDLGSADYRSMLVADQPVALPLQILVYPSTAGAIAVELDCDKQSPLAAELSRLADQIEQIAAELGASTVSDNVDLSPSDFPLADLEQDELDKISDFLNKDT